MSFHIGNKKIGASFPPFIIAEMSGNHNQSLDRALQIVKAASESGADAIKLQTYTADSMTLDLQDSKFQIEDKYSLWDGQNLHQLYEKAATPWEWHSEVFAYAHELGLVCFSSPFDTAAVDFLEELETPAYKIASFENNHLPLIKRVAQTGKPVIISTGMARLSELEDAVSVVKEYGSGDLILLKCTSTYPAAASNTNIRTIPHLKDLFSCEVGLSDHTLGIGVSVASVAMGACVIEKHFTLSRSDGGVDSQFSLEPAEFSLLVEESKRAWESLGEIKYGPTDAESKSLKFKRSIYVSKDVKKDEIISYDNIKIIRPGDGLPPGFIEHILGKKFNTNIKAGSPMSFDYLF